MKTILILFFTLLLFDSSYSQVRAYKMDMSLLKDTSSYSFKRILIKSYENFANEDSTDYGTRYKLSVLYSEIGDYYKSIEVLTYLTKKQPENPNPVGNRAFRYITTKQYDLAKKDFDKAIELDKTNAISYLNRAFLETEINEFDEAVLDLKHAIKLRPDYAKAFANLGDTYNRMGNYKDAIKNCTKAIELSPGYVEALLNRGNVYLKMKNYEAALRDFDLVLKLYPSMGIPEFFLNRGNAKYSTGNKQGAEKEFDKCIKLAYHSDFYRNYMKYEIFNLKGEYSKALIEINKTLNDIINVPEIYENRAELYKKLNNKKAAKADFKKAKDLRNK